MRYCCLLIFVILSCRDSAHFTKTESENIDIHTADELKQKAFERFRKAPKQALPLYKELVWAYGKENNTAQQALSSLNVSNIYDEYYAEYDSALLYAHYSLALWQNLKDSLQMANVLKYIGQLEGHRGEYELALSFLSKAMILYEDHDFIEGTAVSEHNLAEVYFNKGDYIQSLSCLKRSNQIWENLSNTSRMFINNLLEININIELQNEQEIKRLTATNDSILIHYPIDDFNKTRYQELKNQSRIRINPPT